MCCLASAKSDWAARRHVPISFKPPQSWLQLDMSFYLRKSVKFGPVRFNFSKSGIGVSAGVKGARISSGPRGTYVHAGRNGFYYRQKIGGNSHGRAPQSQPHDYRPDGFGWQNQRPPAHADDYKIDTADVSRLVDSSSKNLIDQINTASRQMRIAPFVGVGTAFAATIVLIAVATVLATLGVNQAAGPIVSFLCVVAIVSVGAYLTWQVHRGDELKRTTPLFYELEDEALKKFTTVQNAVSALSRSARIWRLQTEQYTSDRKRNAGASSLVTRSVLSARKAQPPYIATNVEVWSIVLNDQTLYFMPDYVFVRQNGIYGAASYDTFSVDFSTTNFIESEFVPPDSRIVDTTWRFVNRNGGPDRRFSNNRQLPVVQYGFVHFRTRSGMNIQLNVSNVEIASYFSQMFNGIASDSQEYKEQRTYGNGRSQNQARSSFDSELISAFEVLGLSISASKEQIVSAYRQMAKMYHPDRLSHLAPEFAEIAEERMKEINIAFNKIKTSGRV